MPRSLRWLDPETSRVHPTGATMIACLSQTASCAERASTAHEEFMLMPRTRIADGAVVGRGARSDYRSYTTLGCSCPLG